jgi:hypothetical protein
MFTIAIIDTEANWDDPKPKAVMDERFDTREEAEAFAMRWLDQMERAIPDFTQVFSYEVVPLRTADTMASYFASFIGLYNRAYYRESTTWEE